MKTVWLVGMGAISMLTACAMEISDDQIERAEHQPYDDEPQIALAAQALGAVETLGTACTGLCWEMGVGGPFAVVIQKPDDKNLAVANLDADTFTVLGSSYRMSDLAVASDGGMIVADLTNSSVKEYGVFGSTTISSAVGSVEGLGIEGDYVYWVDSRGLNKKKRDGTGSRSLLLDDSMATKLIATDASNAYVLRYIAAGELELRKYKFSDATNTLLRTIDQEPWGVSDDTSYLYWVEGDPTSFYVRRYSKSSGARTTLRATTKQLGYTAARGGVVYWTEMLPGGASMEIIKRSSGGVLTTVRSGAKYYGSLVHTADHLYWLEISTGTTPVIMKRAPH